MNELQIFESNEFGRIRMIEIKGKAYAVGVDVARALGYANPSKAVLDHCKGDFLTWKVIDSLGREQETRLIPEGDIYRLIVKAAEQSNNPEIKAKAERFERWIFDEVIPTIRRTGGYVYNDEVFVETYLPFADDLTKALFKRTLETIRKQNDLIAQMKPKAEYFDALVERNLLTNFRNTAKELKIREREFIQWLLDKGFIYRDKQGNLRPYAQYVPELFEIKEWKTDKTAGIQTLITPKGRETFRLLLKGADRLNGTN